MRASAMACLLCRCARSGRRTERDGLLLLSDGSWTPFSLSRLQGVVAKVALAPLAELPEAILREASRAGRADDMTVVGVRLR